MVGDNTVQLPQDIFKIDLNYNPDLLRKFLSDMQTEIVTLNSTVEELKKRVKELENDGV